MNKCITVTLDNGTSDTLDRYMLIINTKCKPGMKTSKSGYVASAIRAQLIADGMEIVEDESSKNPAPTTPKSPEYEPL